MIGRNEPCPCGSGKKYKKCCMGKQMKLIENEVREQRFFERKHRLTIELSRFLERKCGGLWSFERFRTRPFASFDIGEFVHGCSLKWALFLCEYENGLRGIEWFLEERGHRFTGEDKEMLERWKSLKLSVYQLVDTYADGMIAEDTWTGEQYRMPYCETMMKMPPWSVSLGYIEPYAGNWYTLGVTAWVHPDMKMEFLKWVRDRQDSNENTNGKSISRHEILARDYPELMHRCHEISLQPPVQIDQENHEQIYVTRTYSCENPDRLTELLLAKEDEFIPFPSESGSTMISRVDKSDSILDKLPASRRKSLGLDHIQINRDLGSIEIKEHQVTVKGWKSETLESVFELFDVTLRQNAGLKFIDEQEKGVNRPANVMLQENSLISDHELSEEELKMYTALPTHLKRLEAEWEDDWDLSQVENISEEAREKLENIIRRWEYEQYRINNALPNLNLLRKALGLPLSHFY